MSTILVIGAGGFLGSRVARFLAERPGVVVRAGYHGAGRPAPHGDSLIPVLADVRDIRTLSAALDGVDAVVNCASGDRWVSVNGTQAILTAAAEAKVPRVVQLGSVVVYGHAEGLVGEDTPLAPMADDPDAQLKAEADGLCLRAAAAGQSVIVLRLPVLFGAECVQWAGLAARRLASRRWGTLGDAGEGLCNPIDPRDVLSAVAAAIDAPAGTAGAYNVRGPEVLTWNAFFERYNEALGLPPLTAQNLNGFGMRFLVGALVRETVSHLPQAPSALGGMMAETPTFRELDFFRLGATYAIDKAAADLAWTPGVPFADSLGAAAAWVRSGGLAEMLQKAAAQPTASTDAPTSDAPTSDAIGPVSAWLAKQDHLPSFLTPDGLRRMVPERWKGAAAAAAPTTETDATPSVGSKLFPSHLIFKPMPEDGPTVSMAEAMAEIKGSLPGVGGGLTDGLRARLRRLGDKLAEKDAQKVPAEPAPAPALSAEAQSLSAKLFPAHLIFKPMPEGGPTVSISETMAEIRSSLGGKTDKEGQPLALSIARKAFPAHIIFKKKIEAFREVHEKPGESSEQRDT